MYRGNSIEGSNPSLSAIQLVLQKIRTAPGIWRFVGLNRAGQRYVWDPRPGQYFLEWWEGPKRRRQAASSAPSEALEA